MSTLTNYTEDEIIKHLFRTGTFTAPATLYFALFTTAPDDTGAGTEVTGGSYARVGVAKGDANFAATSGTDGVTSNLGTITFPAPTANWGTVTHMAIFDAASAGNMICYATLSPSRTINNGDPAPIYNIGAFTFTFSGAITDYLENQLILHLFRTGSYTAPTNLYFGLLSTAPDDTGAGTEFSGGAYARVSVAKGDANFDATVGGNGTTANTNAITFPAPSGANWGTASYMAVWDAASAGNMLCYATLPTPRIINDGDPAPLFAAGDFTFAIA